MIESSDLERRVEAMEAAMLPDGGGQAARGRAGPPEFFSPRSYELLSGSLAKAEAMRDLHRRVVRLERITAPRMYPCGVARRQPDGSIHYTTFSATSNVGVLLVSEPMTAKEWESVIMQHDRRGPPPLPLVDGE